MKTFVATCWMWSGIISLVVCAPACASRPASDEVVVYVVAHADDWPLFMGEDVASDLQEGRSVVLIHTISDSAPACWEVGAIAAIVTAIEPPWIPPARYE